MYICGTDKKKPTTVQIVPGGGPYIQFESNFEVTRSAEGKQMGLTHRLNSKGVSSFISEISSNMATIKKESSSN